MNPAVGLSNSNIDGTLPEPGPSDGGAVTEGVPLCSSADNASYESDGSDSEATTRAAPMYSCGNLSNFSIVDSTLREGEQFATAYFSTAQRIKIARALDDLGVEYVRFPT